MPPMYIDIGAYVDDDTVIDSHALVGACAQIGKRVHLGSGAQIGRGLEPIDGLPVVVEDDAMIGAGTILTGSSPIYDLPNARVVAPQAGQPLVVPQRAVVVPGARAVTTAGGMAWGLSLAVPVIVAYHDGNTDVRVELQRWIT
jgi:2,3,4,5-tetrahydropyridine-2-carboxylate N-succinyltransferase